MTRQEIIRMAQEAGINVEQGFLLRFAGVEDDLERFAALVAAAEREKIIAANAPEIEKINAHFKALEGAVAAEREKLLRLWMLLDDIDTADDIAKSDDKLYRRICQNHQKKRWEILSGEEVDAMMKAREQ